ncbi:hypothetical protein ACHAWF_016568, partial [Thalassiosira exigua]
ALSNIRGEPQAETTPPPRAPSSPKKRRDAIKGNDAIDASQRRPPSSALIRTEEEVSRTFRFRSLAPALCDCLGERRTPVGSGGREPAPSEGRRRSPLRPTGRRPVRFSVSAVSNRSTASGRLDPRLRRMAPSPSRHSLGAEGKARRRFGFRIDSWDEGRGSSSSVSRSGPDRPAASSRGAFARSPQCPFGDLLNTLSLLEGQLSSSGVVCAFARREDTLPITPHSWVQKMGPRP